MYNVLIDDLDRVNRAIEREKKKKEEEQNRATFGKNKTEKFTSLNILGAQTSAHTGDGNSEAEDEEEMKNDPQGHFKKLKAKIKLKCVK